MFRSDLIIFIYVQYLLYYICIIYIYTIYIYIYIRTRLALVALLDDRHELLHHLVHHHVDVLPALDL